MNDAVPFDVEPISIIDKATSETFVWSLIIGQEARGHLAYNCSPQTNTTQWFFSPCMNCDINANESIFPPNCGQEDVGLVMCMGDSGSPAITYYRGKPVFTGMLTNTTYTEGQLKYYPDEKQVMVQNSVMNEKCATYSTINYARAGQSSFGEFVGGRGIGSSTMYPLGWGQQISPIQFLNLWLGREGYHANTVSMKRERTDTSFTYPSPDIQYRQDPIPLKPDGRIDDTPISVLTEQNQTA